MSSIKKAYQPMIDLLNAKLAENPKVTVKSVMEELTALCTAQVNRGVGSTFIKNKAGETVAIFDYYFKRWMPLVGDKAVEFGAKQKTATGFNSMCKEGVSNWTKQQREAKNAEANLLKEVAAGNVQPSDIPARQAEIEEARKAIVPTELGFDSVEGIMEYLNASGVEAEAPSVSIAEPRT